MGTVTMATVPRKYPCYLAKEGSRSNTPTLASLCSCSEHTSLTFLDTAMLTSSLVVSPDIFPRTRTSSCKLSLGKHLSITYGN